jgi:signal transduction histidine kinase
VGINLLALECLHETFAARVIVGIRRPTHTRNHVVRLHDPTAYVSRHPLQLLPVEVLQRPIESASATPAAITFTILRPVWQRPWFIALGLLATALATHAVYRYRLGRVLEMANMRTRIATDLHDDIGANLTRIALLSEVATRQDASAGRATPGTPSASIARIARESVGSMSDIVWAVNPARDSLLDLTRRMRQYAEETLVLSGIELRFEADEAREHQRLGGDIRRDLLLIFKEAVNNTARHSRCSRVVIEFGVHGSDLVLRVSDNGVGFDPTHESDGLGVLSMHRRAQRLKGTLVIMSSEGPGTTVTLTIPR